VVFFIQDVGGAGTQPGANYRGKLNLGLMYTPTSTTKGNVLGTVSVAIKQARDLPNMDTRSLTDGFVKCYLLPDRSASGKRKTKVVNNNLNPVWEEEFVYKNVALEKLAAERVLEVTVWDYDVGASNDFIGCLRLGPTPGHAAKHSNWMDSVGEEVSHWEAMLAHPGEWVEKWHTLRPTMDPRNIDLSKLSGLSPHSEARDLRPAMEPGNIDLSKSPSSSPNHEATEEKTVQEVSDCSCVIFNCLFSAHVTLNYSCLCHNSCSGHVTFNLSCPGHVIVMLRSCDLQELRLLCVWQLKIHAFIT